MDDELKHCCGHMDKYTIMGEEDPIIEYESSIRSYTFLLREDNKYIGVNQRLWYCPWCGTKLPEDLGDEWDEALKTEYNLTINDFVDKKGRWDESKIPEEFKTDEWWKKRGLQEHEATTAALRNDVKAASYTTALSYMAAARL